jgi:hypothetical protein
MANKKAKKKTAARAAVAPADKATMVVTLYDGTRDPIEGQDFLIRIFDGFQNQLFDDFRCPEFFVIEWEGLSKKTSNEPHAPRERQKLLGGIAVPWTVEAISFTAI